jgi:outer membrane lipoprotein SlyB
MLKKFAPILLAAPIIFGGCASNISSSQYETSQVGEATRTYQGVVVNKRIVKVEGNTTTQVVSALAGAAAGGVLGNQVGGGSGKTAATVGGAALGGVLGNAAGKKLSAQEAYEYTVKLNDGSMRTVVQGADVDFAVGAHVLLQVSNQGRSRIVADTGTY